MANENFNPYGLRPLDPDKARVQYYPVAASQTIAKNDPVILSSGQVAIAATNSAELLGVAAQASVSAAANTLIAVYDHPDTVFLGRGDADASSMTIGGEYDLTGSTGAFQVDVDASAVDVLVFLGVKAGDTSSNAGADLKVKINKHALADQS